MNKYLTRFQDRPAMIEEGRSAWLEACMAEVAQSEELKQAQKESASGDFWQDGNTLLSSLRPYNVHDGILVVPVKGALLNKFPFAFGEWATGYEYIQAAIQRGLDDSEVEGIALEINSGGGLVSGNWDLVDFIYESRSVKPIRAFADDHAYSAAYNIAAAAEHLTVNRTGGVGSIGVVIVHMEMSRMLDNQGVTVNIIRSKPGKMRGNSYEELNDSTKKRLQAEVDEFHDQFVAMVARNRGLNVSAVDGTDALTFMPQQALDVGLADEIGSFTEGLTAFAANPTTKRKEVHMATENKAEFTKEQLDAAVAEATETAKAEGARDGQAQAVARVKAILESEAGVKRPKAALGAALKTSMSVEEATAFLGELAEETVDQPKAEEKTPAAGAPAGMLEAAMAAEGVNVAADLDGEEPADTPAAKVTSRIDRIMALRGQNKKDA